MDAFTIEIGKIMADQKLWPRKGPLLVGVSGGLDSVVLLHVLHELAQTNHRTLVVAHLNHRLRGRDAGSDQRLVNGLARRLGLQCDVAQVDVAEYAVENKLSIEMAARKVRHRFLALAAKGHGCNRIALAHHADDQVETFLLRLLRGAGPDGLGGMRWSAPSPADGQITLIRPLLACTKAQLAEFASARKIRFREDKTNASLDMLRNRIRHELLPLLRRNYQPAVESVLLRQADLLRDEADYVRIEAENWSRATGRKDFRTLPVALQRRVAQQKLFAAGITPDFALIESLRTKISQWHAVSSGLLCRCCPDGELEIKPSQAQSFDQKKHDLELEHGGILRFGGLDVHWTFQKGNKVPPPKFGREYFDAEATGTTIQLRHWQAGDRFHPIGGRPVKLQDFFVNEKVPRDRRHKVLLAVNANGEIFWIEGMRIGESCKVTGSTRRMLVWRWKR